MLRFSGKLRGLTSSLLTVVLAAAGLVMSSSPAHASYVNQILAPNNVYTVGDAIDFDFTCQPSDGSEQVGNSASPIVTAPPGTSYDTNNNHLTGTLTTPGTFDLGDIRCFHNGEDTSLNWYNHYAGSIIVKPATTPVPTLLVHDLKTASCDVLITAVLPATPESGSVKLAITEETVISLRDVSQGELISIQISLLNISQSALISPFVTGMTGVGDHCGKENSYTLSYSYLGAPIAYSEKILTVDVTTPSGPVVSNPAANVVVSEVFEAACTIDIHAKPNFVPTDGLLHFLFFEFAEGDAGPKSSFAVDVIINAEWSSGTDFRLNILDIPGSLEGHPAIEYYEDAEIENCQDVQWMIAASAPGQQESMMINSSSDTNSWGIAKPICPAGTYGAIVEEEGKFSRNCLPAPAGFYVAEENVLAQPSACRNGSFSDLAGATECTPAPAGSFVKDAGSRTSTFCPLGTYSPEPGAVDCIPAARGFYVDTMGATSAKKCSAGQSTALEGARSKYECYTQKTQTVKTLKLPSVLKVGAKLDTIGVADTGIALKAYTTGSCTVKATTKTVKIKGKSVKQPRWVITAGKTAGTCKVEFTNAGDVTYKPFNLKKTIKVTKTGK